MRALFKVLTGICLVAGLFTASPVSAQKIDAPLDFDASSAVVFVYFRVGEDSEPQTSIRLDQFTQQIQELIDGEYNVASLPDVMNAIKDGTPLPERTVVITFDGGFKSAMEKALPVLAEHDLPFTVFFSPNLADGGADQYLDWGDIKKLARMPRVTLGLHTASYGRVFTGSEEELRRQVNSAIARTRDVLGKAPDYFSYPFGEYDAKFRTLISQQNFIAAFGQQSGVAYSGADMYALPRFPMTESFGDMERFRMTASARPLPASDIQPEDPFITKNPPSIGFTVDPALSKQMGALTCFLSGQKKPDIYRAGDTRIEVRLNEPLSRERSRLNCTMPAGKDSEGNTIWRWHGMLLTLPEQEIWMENDVTEP